MGRGDDYRVILGRLGYYSYQEGIIFRHLAQGNNWDTHLANCRKFIMGAIERFSPSRVTILGSGWLLDLPLAEITAQGIEVFLVDIIHPPGVKEQTSAMPGVHLVESDITGGLVKQVYQKTRGYNAFRRMKNIDDIEVPVHRFDHDPGLVISLNLLSQLDFLPVRQIRAKGYRDNHKIDSFRKTIQQKHLEMLAMHNSVLITDYLEIFTDSAGLVTEEKTVLADIPEGFVRDEWTWDFDTKATDYNLKSSVLKVIAVIPSWQ
ncbi:MAG: hypothetical protein U0X39_00510 [Bacteroidales bacterium]